MVISLGMVLRGNTFGTVAGAQRDAPWVDDERRPKTPKQAHRGWNGLQTFQGQGFPRRSARKWRILTHGHIVPGPRRPAESPQPVGDGCALAFWVLGLLSLGMVVRFSALRVPCRCASESYVILGGWVGSLLTDNYQRQRARQLNKWRANGRAETPGQRGRVPDAPATNAGFTPRADGAREGATPAPQSRPPNIRQ